MAGAPTARTVRVGVGVRRPPQLGQNPLSLQDKAPGRIRRLFCTLSTFMTGNDIALGVITLFAAIVNGALDGSVV